MKQNKKGISLIVLVITIIVMIILAAAIILSLNGSNVIGKANEATSASDLANAKQVLSVARSEWKMMTIDEQDNIGDFSVYAKKKLEEAGFKKSGKFSDEVLYAVDEFSPTSAVNKVEVGDYVLYTYTGVSGFNLEKKDTGVETVQSFDSTSTGADKVTAWRVIGTDNGVITLASEKMVRTGESNVGLQLDGKVGYLNGPKILDEMCKTLYSGDFGTARNLKIADVKKVLDVARDGDIESSGEAYYSYVDKTGTTIKMSEGTTIGEIEKNMAESDKTPNRFTPAASIVFEEMPITYFRYDIPKLNESDNDNYWWTVDKVYANEQLLELVWPGTYADSMWLSDSVIRLDMREGGYVYYCLAALSGKRSLNTISVYFSDDTTVFGEDGKYRTFKYRPVVELKPGLQIELNTTKTVSVWGDSANTAVFNVWEIKQQ